MLENTENDEDDTDDTCRYRVMTTLTVDERAKLEHLAKRDGRSMSSYLRHILREDIDANGLTNI